MLGFVANDTEERDRFEEFEITDESAVEVIEMVLTDFSYIVGSVAPMMNVSGKLGQIFQLPFQFSKKEAGQTTRDTEASIFLTKRGYKGKVWGFPQTHFVGKNSPELIAEEVQKPSNTNLLIGTKGGIKDSLKTGRGERGEVP